MVTSVSHRRLAPHFTGKCPSHSSRQAEALSCGGVTHRRCFGSFVRNVVLLRFRCVPVRAEVPPMWFRIDAVNLQRCLHRCQFALLGTRVGCIDRPQRQEFVTRSGVFFRETPLQIESIPICRRVVQLPRLDNQPKLPRRFRPLRLWLIHNSQRAVKTALN